MQASDEGGRRRRRRPRRAAAPDVTEPAQAESGDERARSDKPGRAERRQPGEGRGLRNLVGAGPSQLGVGGALRGRDVNRPTEADLAEAERDVVIVRRNWKPPP